MKFMTLCIFLQALATAPAFAALPPLYETLAEFRSLINSKELTDRLSSGESLVNISKDDKGFVVETNKHRLDVEIVYEPAQRPGPAHFHLDFKEAKPLSKE